MYKLGDTVVVVGLINRAGWLNAPKYTVGMVGTIVSLYDDSWWEKHYRVYFNETCKNGIYDWVYLHEELGYQMILIPSLKAVK